jgi:hypothetical protein
LEYIVTTAEKGVDSQVTMPLEKNTDLIDTSPFMKSDETVVYIRLHRSVIQEALGNGKALGIAQAIRTLCKDGNLARSAP